jgi:hypothetical protein
METQVQIITGPPTARIAKAEAEAQLLKHPEFPKGASYELEAVEGRWVAAIASVKEATTKESAPPAFAEGAPDDAAPSGPPSDEAPEGPPSEAEEPKGEDADDKPGDEGKDEPKGEKGELQQLVHMLTTLMDALGLSPNGPEDSPIPGADEATPGPPLPPPDAPGGDNKTHTVHERALKPGEAPPGTTPVGSPSFASTHPWADVLNKKRSFTVQEEIGDQPISKVAQELAGLANGTGYEVKQLRAEQVGDKRVARAIIAKA